MKIKNIGFLIAVIMASMQSWANEPITFIERSWNGTQVVETEKTITDYELWGPDTWHTSEDNYTLNAYTQHYYVVKGRCEFYGILDIQGEAHIILCDAEDENSGQGVLFCKKGIRVVMGNSLHIHSCSNRLLQGGIVRALSSETDFGYQCAIGADGKPTTGSSTGLIYIHGGRVEAVSEDDEPHCPGIGARFFGQSFVTIYGGSVYAKGGDYAPGIGSGEPANINIYGGDVTAVGGVYGAGIGTASLGNGWSKINIFGGNIEATGGKYAAGIGGGKKTACGELKIGGSADITAQGGKYGPGIGGGGSEDDESNYSNSNNFVYISGGNIIARGGDYAPGVGSGKLCFKLNFLMEAGTLEAYGGEDAAGIGLGEGGKLLSTSEIFSGYINIKGTSTVKAVGKGYGAGIGGGEDCIGIQTDINENATVEAIAGIGVVGFQKKGGAAIGSGNISWYNIVDTKEDVCRGLGIGNESKVTAAIDESQQHTTYPASQRIEACRWNSYAKVEPCSHSTLHYTYVDDEQHKEQCEHCEYAADQQHVYDATTNTCVCGKEKEKEPTTHNIILKWPESKSSTGYDRQEIRIGAVEGTEYILPGSDIDGLVFQGWTASPKSTGSFEKHDQDLELLKAGDKITIGDGDITLYARYLYDYRDVWTWAPDYSSASVNITMAGLTTLNQPATITHTTTPATSDQAGSDTYEAVCTYKHVGQTTYTISSHITIPRMASLTLDDATDNSQALSNYEEVTVETVSISGRTLTKENEQWNTLCLPFDLTVSGSSLDGDGVSVMQLSGSSFSNETLSLQFSPVTQLEAGTPYIVKWTSGSNITPPQFSSVFISNAGAKEVTKGVITFKGTYAPIVYKKDKVFDTVLLVGPNNVLYYPDGQEESNVNAFRAFFILNNGYTYGTPYSNVKTIRFDFGDEATAVNTIDATNQIPADGYYTLQGIRLSEKPTTPGLYIYRSKKILVK